MGEGKLGQADLFNAVDIGTEERETEQVVCCGAGNETGALDLEEWRERRRSKVSLSVSLAEV